MRNQLLLPTLGLLMLCFYSCTRNTGSGGFPTARYAPVFGSADEAAETVAPLLAKKGEQLKNIDQVVYLQTDNKACALVYFTTATGKSNILIEYTYAAETLMQKKSYRCVNGTCDCKVVANVDAYGVLHVECNCNTCTLEVSNV